MVPVQLFGNMLVFFSLTQGQTHRGATFDSWSHSQTVKYLSWTAGLLLDSG